MPKLFKLFKTPKPGKWLVYAQHECLYLTGPAYAGDHIVAAMNMSTCPKCGEPCDLFNRDTWARVIRRKISERVWYKPSTWGKYHWEYRSKGHLETGGYNFRKHGLNAKKLQADESDVYPKIEVKESSRGGAPSRR